MPEIYESIASFRTALELERDGGLSVGVVPTMGYLHAGHAALMRQASAENDTAALTIFVNPLQFAAGEDFDTYPRDHDGDIALAAESGIAHVFTPTLAEMYPQPVLTTVSVADITERFEGASRPEHFAGVATVVAKLLAITGAVRAYFGEKDYQQLALVRRMVADLSMPVDVVGCPVVRDADGLALSSRNLYLTPAQRAAAPVLHRGLCAARSAVQDDGERDLDVVRSLLADAVTAEPEAILDYAEVVDAHTIEPATSIGGEQRLLIAAGFGPTRLLDNMAVSSPPSPIEEPAAAPRPRDYRRGGGG